MGQEPQTRECPAADSLAALLEKFAEAVDGGAPFPVSPEQMLDTVAAFEALIKSMESRRPVAVPGRGTD
jgi:predicted dehydrogenase